MQFSKSINRASAPVWKKDVAEIIMTPCDNLFFKKKKKSIYKKKRKEKSKAKQCCSVLTIRKPRQCSHLFPVTYPEFLPGDTDN